MPDENLTFQGAGPCSDVGGAWVERDGIITPPGDWADDHLTFFRGQAYADFEADFEFRLQTNHSGAGLVVGAQSATDFHLVHFPCCGQQYRAKHFWVAVSQSQDSGWLKLLKMDMLRGVASELGGGDSFLGPWHHARIVVKGTQISIWVDRRPFPPVTVEGLKPGYLGLESWTYHGNPGSAFRNIRIRGTAADAPPWDDTVTPNQSWFIPFPAGGANQGEAAPRIGAETTGAEHQWITNLSDGGIAKSGDGSLLTNISGTLLRSTDVGKTWQQVESDTFEAGSLLVGTRDGKVLAFRHSAGERNASGELVAELRRAVSEDCGQTWSPYELTKQDAWQPETPMDLHPMQGIIELSDGTLVGFQAANKPHWQLAEAAGVVKWGALHCSGWSSRSTDQGLTWSAPVPLDGPPGAGMNMDNCEFISNIQAGNGDVLCLGRPIYSPWMWETWSHDKGVTWQPTTRGPFCSYATASPSQPTASGALVVAGRMPGLAAYVSFDDGITWQGYRIGTDAWAMGSMLEVAPDVILYIFMDSRGGPARGQFLRVTPDGLEPARDMLPA
jgi:hypothetical protein